MFNFLRDHHSVFHGEHTILHSNQQCTRLSFSFYTSSSVLVTASFLDFFNDQWCWPFFHMFVGHLYVIFGEYSSPWHTFKLDCRSFCWIMSSLGFLDTKPLSDVWFAEIFSQSVRSLLFDFLGNILWSTHFFFFFFFGCPMAYGVPRLGVGLPRCC